MIDNQDNISDEIWVSLAYFTADQASTWFEQYDQKEMQRFFRIFGG